MINLTFLLEIFEITEQELSQVRELGKTITPKLDEFVSEFYSWLKPQPDYQHFFSNSSRLEHVMVQQKLYWQQTFKAIIDDDFIESRRNVGVTHARIGLSLETYLAAMSKSLSCFQTMNAEHNINHEFQLQQIALAKLIHLETFIVIQAYSEITEQKIENQSRSLLEMSTPVTSIWQGVLMLPIVGILDSKRAQDLMHTVLAKINETQSKAIILDISGVAVVDTAVANHIIKITKASKLMGCECIVSGLSPSIAQTMVELGIEVENLTTTSTLSDALESALTLIGLNIVSKE